MALGALTTGTTGGGRPLPTTSTESGMVTGAELLLLHDHGVEARREAAEVERGVEAGAAFVVVRERRGSRRMPALALVSRAVQVRSKSTPLMGMVRLPALPPWPNEVSNTRNCDKRAVSVMAALPGAGMKSP